MKLKIFISIITVLAILQCTGANPPVVRDPDQTLPGKIHASPEYKNGKFDDMGTTLNMSFTEFVSTTWDFLFADNQRTPDTHLPVIPENNT